MSKVTPIARQFVVATGAAGLVAVGALAGAVSAHAAESPVAGGLPLSTNAVGALKGLMEHNHSMVAGLPVKTIPLVGDVPSLLGVLPADKLPGLDGVDLASSAGGMERARAHGAPVSPPAVEVPRGMVAPGGAAPMMQGVPQAAGKGGGSSAFDGVAGVTDMLPMKLPLGGIEKSLPIGGQLGGGPLGGAGKAGGGLPIVSSLPLAGSLPGLSGIQGGSGSGGGDFLSALPVGSLTSGLGHLAG